MSFNFSLLDAEKARKGSTRDDKEGPMHIRPYTLDSSEYSVHTLSFEISKNSPKTPVQAAFHPPSATSAAIIQTLNKGSERHSTTMKTSYVSHTDGDRPKSSILTREKERSGIQPPPEALQAPYKETHSRKETPSLMTQATGTSTNSSTQAVITFARKDPVATATARTLLTSTMSSRHRSPVDMVTPHEAQRPGNYGKI